MSYLGHRLRSGRLGDQGWQADGCIIADWGDAFQHHVAGPLDGPLIVLFEQDGFDEPPGRGLVGEDTDDICPAFDLAIDGL